MFDRILLPIDLTEQSQKSVAAVLELIEASGGTVTLLHVIETIADVDFEEMQDFYRRLERKASATLEQLARPLADAGCEVERQVVYGQRVREIVLFASEHDVDLIVMSSRGLDPQSPATAWTSISHQVAILASCPVLLLK